jgi:uncharacterized protein YhaN
MRLRRLDLARYGKFTDGSIDFGERVADAPDLHIVYGPNEAGKSTAFTGFLDLIFGIEARSRYGFLHPYETMKVGGCLELPTGAHELVRIKKPHPTLRNAHNEPVAEGLILAALSGLDRNAYLTMFSLDDDTLEAGGQSILSSNGELGQLLFSATAGLAALSKTLMDLRSKTDTFFTEERPRSGELQQLRASLDNLKKERDAIDTFASAYSRLVSAKDNAAAQYKEALAERTKAQTDLERVQALLDALPRHAELRQIAQQLEPLSALPDAPPGWLAQLPELQEAESLLRSKSEQAEIDVKRQSDELTALIVDETALNLVGRLDRLAELRARQLTAELDLPGRRQDFARIEGEVRSILMRLGREDEDEPARLMLNAAQSAALNSLIVARSGIKAKTTAAIEELSQATNALNEAHLALHQHDSGAAGGLLLSAVKSALQAVRDSDHRIHLRNATRARSQHSESLKTRLMALKPWRGSAEQLVALTVPDAASIEAWRVKCQDNDARLDTRRDMLRRIETELKVRTAELDAFARTSGLVSDQEAAVIRGAREAAWAEHRRTLDPASADAFEAAMRQDDIVSNLRLGNERDLAKLHETKQALAVKRAEAECAREWLAEASMEQKRHVEHVARAAGDIGPEMADISPARLLGWAADRDKALEAWGLLRGDELAIDYAQAGEVGLRGRLADALTLAGVIFEPLAGLEELAAAAQAAVDRETHAQTLHQAVADCEREVRKRQLAADKAASAEQTWLDAWRAACAACWLGEDAASLPFETVREMLTAAAALAPKLEPLAGLATRIQDMERDQAAFGRELEEICPKLGIETGQKSGLDLAQAITDRVHDAKRAAERRQQLESDLLAAQKRHRQAASDGSAHARRVGEMKDFMKAGSLIELAGKLRDSETKADLQHRAAKIHAGILAKLRVERLTDAQTLLADKDVSALEAEKARLTAHLVDLDTRTHELFAASKQADDRIAAVGGDDAAARIEERRRTKLLEIEDKARHYLRLRIGLAAADRALRAYRDQHRSSMMTQASDAFRMISRGAYRGLGTQPDKNGDILVAITAEGSSKLATDLSKGTRFQLYLALRAAGYQEFARVRPTVPFIADDIMETFDDLRAEETLRVFEEMARLGQVIYLTHHDHLRALAERTVPGARIHRLVS